MSQIGKKEAHLFKAQIAYLMWKFWKTPNAFIFKDKGFTHKELLIG